LVTVNADGIGFCSRIRAIGDCGAVIVGSASLLVEAEVPNRSTVELLLVAEFACGALRV
jgi:hypothetical protein